MKKLGRYHIHTTPETVKSLLQDGIFPVDIPHYVLPNSLKIVNVFSDASIVSHTTADQIFIVEVSGPKISRKIDFGSDIFEIDPEEVTRIFVNSAKGFRLFKALIGEEFKIPIIIDNSLFSVIKPKLEDKKRKREEPKKESDTPSSNSYVELEKKLKLKDSLSPVGGTSEETVVHVPENYLLRLSGTDEHAKFLHDAFKRAKHQILITSYSLRNETFKILNLFNLMREARLRGVKIYIYYSDQKDVDASVFRFIEQQGIFLDFTYTHSKLFVVDNCVVAIGSFNWLSGVTNRYPNACDGTLVLQNHDMCGVLKEDLWNHIKRYRNIQFSNRRQMRRFDSQEDNFVAIDYPINGKESVTYLPTLEQQSEHLAESFEIAEKSIVICSPFISLNGEFFEDFDHKTLRQVSARKVDVVFVCNANDKNLREFQYFLEKKVNSSFVHLVLVPNFHLKTVIVDDEEICEGSFNWLSAVRDEESEYHNHEAAFVVSGELATPLIDHFYNSLVGQAIREHFRILSSEKSEEDSSEKSVFYV